MNYPADAPMNPVEIAYNIVYRQIEDLLIAEGIKNGIKLPITKPSVQDIMEVRINVARKGKI